MKLRTILAVACFLLLPSCASAQAFITGQVRVQPTDFHEFIYHAMEECTGRRGDFAKVEWYLATSIVVGTQTASGMWTVNPETKRSMIFADRDSFFSGTTISHEVLHDLYKGDVGLDLAQRCILSWERLKPIQ